MKEENPNRQIESKLEARIVALVLGEASDFERDALQCLIKERPELRALQEQIQNVHGLLRDVAKGEFVADDDDWKLSADKREQLLAVIRGESNEHALKTTVLPTTKERKKVKKNILWTFGQVAAIFCCVGFLGYWVLLTNRNQLASDSADRPLMAMYPQSAAVQDTLNASQTAAFPELPRSLESWEGTAFGGFDSEASDIDYKDSSELALSSIRESLAGEQSPPSPYFLYDDVQFFSVVPEVKLQTETAAPGNRESTKSDQAATAPMNRSQQLPTGDKLAEGYVPNDIDGDGAPTTEWQSAMRGGTSARIALPSITSGQNIFSEPEIANGIAEFSAPARDAPIASTTIVPDSGTVLLGGIRKHARGLGATADSGERTNSSSATQQGAKESEREAITRKAPTVGKTTIGLSDQIAREGEQFSYGYAKSSELDQSEGSDRGWYYRSLASSELEHDSVTSSVPSSAGSEREKLDDQLSSESLARESSRTIAGLNLLKLPKDLLARIDGRNRRENDVRLMLADSSGSRIGLNEQAAKDDPFSTFSLHVSDVSFKLAHAALAKGEWPEAAKIRIEEFVNAFDYGDPMPSGSEKVACRVEQCIHPFLQQRNLLRVALRTAAAGRSSDTPLRLTFLLDNSGSMERYDRQQIVRSAFAQLAKQLNADDQITLISFARQSRLLADQIPGDQLEQLVQLIDNLPSQGGTNMESALRLGYEKAREQHDSNAQNRIILLTDGAVNLGDADPGSLSRMILTMRDAGIAFDAAGISAEGLNDEILESLTRDGDGRYYLLDSAETADDGFARQIAAALRPSAKNVKVQIEFNPRRVGHYKLLGFEKHLLKQEDFRNDQVDAAELSAAEAGVAVYQFESKPDGEGDVGSVSVRFRDISTGQMIENRWPIPYEVSAPRAEQSNASLRVAAVAALLAAKLRGEPLGESVNLKTLSNLLASLPDRVRDTKRVQQLQLMTQQARHLSGQ